MALAETWDETRPADTRRPSLGDDDIRQGKRALRERLAVEHTFLADETGSNIIGRHVAAAGRLDAGVAASKPSTEATGMVQGKTWWETDNSRALYYDVAAAEWKVYSLTTHDALTKTYTTGTADFTNANATVAGTGTAWTTGIAAGDVMLGADGEYYAVSSISNDTSLELDRVYAGATAADQSYTVYLYEHLELVRKSGGTINGALAVGGALAVTGATTHGAAVAMGTNKITGLGQGTTANDAVAFPVGTAELEAGAVAGCQFTSAEAQHIAQAAWTNLLTVNITTYGLSGEFITVDFDAHVVTQDQPASGVQFRLVIDAVAQGNSLVEFSTIIEGSQGSAVITYFKTGLSAASHAVSIQAVRTSATPGSVYGRRLRVIDFKR